MPSYTEFSVGGGLLDDVNVRFTNCRFETYDYNGKADPAPAFRADLVNIDTDEESDQAWSCGKLEDWEPSEDGAELMQVGSKEMLAESSNFVQLLKSLGNAGVSAETFAGLEKDITMLDGLEAHVIRQKMERKGLKKKEREDGREFDMTVLVVDEILSAPWDTEKKDKKPAPKKAPAKGAAKKEATEETGGGDDLTEKAQDFVRAVIAMKGGEVQKKDLSQAGFDKEGPLASEDVKTKNAIIKMCFKDEFLSAIEGVKFENGTLTME